LYTEDFVAQFFFRASALACCAALLVPLSSLRGAYFFSIYIMDGVKVLLFCVCLYGFLLLRREHLRSRIRHLSLCSAILCACSPSCDLWVEQQRKEHTIKRSRCSAFSTFSAALASAPSPSGVCASLRRRAGIS